jgi:hypothetical protein
MRTIHDATLKATVVLDDAGEVRAINHLDEYREMHPRRGRDAAAAYVRDIAGNVNIAPAALRNLEQRVSYLDPRTQEVEYRLSEEKTFFDSTTYAYCQTLLNTPVWAAGVSATVKHAPARVVAASSTSARGIDAKMPSAAALERYRRLFATGEKAPDPQSRPAAGRPQVTAVAASSLLTDILGKTALAAHGRNDAETTPRLIRGRFFVYRYEAAARTKDHPRQRSEHDAEPDDDQPLCGASAMATASTTPGMRSPTQPTPSTRSVTRAIGT